MTDKARELLEQVIAEADSSHFYSSEIDKEIRAYLAQPEVKPQPFNQAEFDEMVRKGTEAWKDYKPEQDEEPVAWTCQDELNALGTDVTCYMYAEPLVGENNIPLYLHPAPRKQDDEPVARLHITETDTYPVIDVEVLNGEMLQPSMSPINVYTIQQKPFVRLSGEEIMAIVRADPDFDEMMWDKTAVRFARAIENALEEKNK